MERSKDRENKNKNLLPRSIYGFGANAPQDFALMIFDVSSGERYTN